MVTILCGDRRTELSQAHAQPDDLWIPLASLEAVSGWTLKPEGMCLDDFCIPLPPERREAFVQSEQVNLSEFWRYREAPVVHDGNHDVWVLGEPAIATENISASTQAPNFCLPDLTGRTYCLSQFAGKKVLLLAWASW